MIQVLFVGCSVAHKNRTLPGIYIYIYIYIYSHTYCLSTRARRPLFRPSVGVGASPDASKTSDSSKAVEHFRKVTLAKHST